MEARRLVAAFLTPVTRFVAAWRAVARFLVAAFLIPVTYERGSFDTLRQDHDPIRRTGIRRGVGCTSTSARYDLVGLPFTRTCPWADQSEVPVPARLSERPDRPISAEPCWLAGT